MERNSLRFATYDDKNSAYIIIPVHVRHRGRVAQENKEDNATNQKGKQLEMLKNMSEEERAALMEEAS